MGTIVSKLRFPLAAIVGRFRRSRNCGENEMRRVMNLLPKAVLADIICQIWMNRGEPRQEWVAMYMVADAERKHLRRILKSEYHTDKELNRAQHMANLETKVKRQAQTIRDMQVSAEHHNRQAYATGLIVNCTGCDRGQPFDGQELTEDRVQAVENIALRLRSWFDNHQYRLSRDTKPAP